MFYIYVLRSLKNNKRYTGITSKTPQERLEEHNSGTNSYTKNNRPFVLIYNESCQTLESARRRESFLKTGQGRQCLDELNI